MYSIGPLKIINACKYGLINISSVFVNLIHVF